MADSVFQVIARELAIEEGHYEAVQTLLAKHGYEELRRFPATARLRHHSLLLPDVDFMLLDRSTMQQLLVTGQQIEIQGATYLIPSVINLITMKMHALKNNSNREWKDLPDIGWLCIMNRVDVESEPFHSLIRRYGSIELHDKIRQQIRSLQDSGSGS